MQKIEVGMMVKHRYVGFTGVVKSIDKGVATAVVEILDDSPTFVNYSGHKEYTANLNNLIIVSGVSSKEDAEDVEKGEEDITVQDAEFNAIIDEFVEAFAKEDTLKNDINEEHINLINSFIESLTKGGKEEAVSIKMPDGTELSFSNYEDFEKFSKTLMKLQK